MKEKTLYLTRAALIAAFYVIFNFSIPDFRISKRSYSIQTIGVSDVYAAVLQRGYTGLAVGCVLANILTGCALWDIIFGSIATLIGALGTYYIGRKKPVLGPVFPILANMIIVPLVLQYVYGAPDSYWYLMVTVGLGEIVCCGLLGGLLYKAYKRAV